MNADSILSQAERSAAHLTNQADRLAHECGVLRGRIRELCDKLKQYEPPADLPHVYEVTYDDIPFQVAVAFDKPDAAGPVAIDQIGYYIHGVEVSNLLTKDIFDALDADAYRQSRLNRRAA